MCSTRNNDFIRVANGKGKKTPERNSLWIGVQTKSIKTLKKNFHFYQFSFRRTTRPNRAHGQMKKQNPETKHVETAPDKRTTAAEIETRKAPEWKEVKEK